MNYKTYQHIEKLGTTDVEGILSGTCYLSYKIDGTNACVWLKDDQTLGFGSRKRELSVSEDNAGFLNTLSSKDYTDEYNDILNYLKRHPSHIIYGEWLVRHTLTKYNQDAWRKLYVFDIFDANTDSYVNYDVYSKEFEADFKNIRFIPIIAKLENPTEDIIKSYLDKTGDWLLTEGLGEGIVIKNYNYRNRFGHIKWAKVLTEDFKNSKSRVREENSDNKDKNLIEYEISKMITDEHILKEKSKIIEHYGEWSSKYIFELLNRSFTEFWRDNWEIILKKFRNPTINFLALKRLSDERVKELL